MRLHPSALPTLLLTTMSNALALPNPSTNHLRREPITPTTGITYCQGNLNSAAACSSPAIAVAHGNITAGTCNTAHTYGIALQPLPRRACNYTLFPGVTDCQLSAGGPAPVVKALMPGQGPACVATGVYDGGEHVFASGVLLCA